jgi:hypothetical protein
MSTDRTAAVVVQVFTWLGFGGERPRLEIRT